MQHNSSVSPRTVLYVSVVICIWSVSATVETVTLRGLSPMQFSLWSTAAGSLGLILALAMKGSLKSLGSYRLQDHMQLLLFAVLGFCGYQTLKYTAYITVPVPQANILQYTYPVFIVIFAMPFLNQRLTFTKITGIAAGFIGAAIILSGGSFTGIDRTHFSGYLLALSAGFSWGLFSVLASRAAFEPVSSMFFMQLYSTVIVLSIVLLRGMFVIPGGFRELAGVIFSGIISNAIGVLLWLDAQRSTNDVSLITGSLYLIPFLSLVAFRVFLSIPIPFYTYTGLVFIVGGMVFHTIWSRRYSGKNGRAMRPGPAPHVRFVGSPEKTKHTPDR
ncbi:DMT family transporter [bacterium]|nr:DMT family transporter [bacterium]